MVLTLGMRHGFDLDHLATIDSITRASKENIHVSKLAGFLFSLGHGLIVILMSFIIGSGFIHANSPPWLATFGNWISIFFLFVFGFLTLWSLLPHAPVLPTSLRGFLVKKLLGKNYNPFLIILVGAFFAFSFDTFTQVALFSISGSLTMGSLFSLILGIIFMLGMMISDGLNGFFVSFLIQLADKRSLLISRLLGLLIAFFSILVGLINVLAQS